MTDFKPNITNPNYTSPTDNFSSEFSNLNSKEKIKKASEQFEAFFLGRDIKRSLQKLF
jgi:flagellar protein FlgJ